MSKQFHRRNFSLLGQLQQRSNSPSQLHRSLRKIKITSNHGHILASAKQQYFKYNNIKQALPLFLQYLSFYPNHVQSLYLCGLCYLYTQEYREAVKKLCDYLGLKKVSLNTNRKLIINSNLPNNSRIYLLLSIAYYKLGMGHRSLEMINQALKIQPNYQQAYCFRAKVYLKQNQAQKAFLDYRQALKHNPRCISAEIGLGDYYTSVNNFQHSLKYYQNAYKILLKQKSLEKEKWEEETNIYEIELKISICLYHLQDHLRSISILQSILLNNKNPQKLTQIYYYLALNQIKQNQLKNNLKQQWNFDQKLLQQNYLHKALLNLQCSIQSNSNKKIMIKACRLVIKILVENNQFYETANIVKIARQHKLDIKIYEELSEGCMLVIKQKYQESLPILRKLLSEVMRSHEKKNTKISGGRQFLRRNNLEISDPQNKKLRTEQDDQQEQLFLGKQPYHLNMNKEKKISNNNHFKNNIYLKTSTKKIKSMRNSQSNNHYSIVKTPTSKCCEENNEYIYEQDQIEWMKPIILLFKAYSEYFQSYELYENYIKDYLGKQAENDIYLSYNKILCQGLLMLENQMIEQSLQKFNLALDNYYHFFKNITVEPILFRIITLLKIALSQQPILSITLDSTQKILSSILQIFQYYMPIVKHNYLIHYYHGIVMYILEKYQESSDIMEKCLKLADECTWKFLYVKGVIQMKRRMYKEAIREFTAGLMLEERAEFFLGRCLSYIGLYHEDKDEETVFIEKSFEDLQKFIEVENDKDKISQWVTKILFYNRAYEEVSKSITKFSKNLIENNEEIISIIRSINIYQGQFQEGGVMGRIIMNAFDGIFQKDHLVLQQDKHYIVFEDYFQEKYQKWLTILSLYSQQKYHQLIKYLQIKIFQEKNSQEILELRYNLAIIYYCIGENTKADNVLTMLDKHSTEISERIQKFVHRKFSQDQCVNDLYDVFKTNKRMSAYLPYRKITVPVNEQIAHSSLTFYIKISVPFPQFPKPKITLNLQNEFLRGQTFQTSIPKKIQAPWIKKVTGKIQFTDNMIQSEQTSFLNLESNKICFDQSSYSLVEGEMSNICSD